MRQQTHNGAKRAAGPNPLPPGPSVSRPILGEYDPLTDWTDVGRRVLAEAMRRSMREFRRRNGCGAQSGVSWGQAEGWS